MKLNEKQAKELLNNFFRFVNFDIDSMEFDNLLVLSMGYVRIVHYEDVASRIENYKKKYELLTAPAIEQSSEKFAKIKEFLKGVQTHQRSILNNLMDKKSPKAIEQEGTRVLTIVDDKVLAQFKVKKLPVNKLDVELEKKAIEYVFADILVYGDLIPSRFKRCQHCKGYFYQWTAKDKQYCSNNCSSVIRQREYQKGQRKKQGKDKGK